MSLRLQTFKRFAAFFVAYIRCHRMCRIEISLYYTGGVVKLYYIDTLRFIIHAYFLRNFLAETTLTLVQIHVCQFKTAIFLWAMAGFLELIFYICGIFKSKTHAADISSFIFPIVL